MKSLDYKVNIKILDVTTDKENEERNTRCKDDQRIEKRQLKMMRKGFNDCDAGGGLV